MLVAAVGKALPTAAEPLKAGFGGAAALRQLFFALTFFSIGVVSDFGTLKKEGMGKLAAIYVLCLFGFIIWIGLAVSFLFFHGMVPPLAAG